MTFTPEQIARQEIDKKLEKAGFVTDMVIGRGSTGTAFNIFNLLLIKSVNPTVRAIHELPLPWGVY